MQLRKSRPFNRFVFKPLVFVLMGSGAIDLGLGVYLNDLGPDPHETLLHTSGEWGLISIMITLTVSPAMKWFSWPMLSNVRRMCGLYTAFYATLHIWVYIQFILGFDWSLLLQEVIKRPYITIGFIAWLLLLPLAATSNLWSMRKLGARWKSLHKATYLIAMLIVWHFAWQVKLDLTEPIIYLICLTILLAWRDKKRLKNSRLAK